MTEFDKLTAVTCMSTVGRQSQTGLQSMTLYGLCFSLIIPVLSASKRQN